jgi:pyruvate formate lyase activating enzyme
VNKGLIFDIRRFTVHDGPGIRTTVFFKGCPLNCWWCHNPESHSCHPEESLKTLNLDGKKFSLKEMIGKWMSVDEVMSELRMDRIFYAESSGGVTFSGGEPLMQPEFLLELLKECKANSLHTTLDTSGYADQEIIEKMYSRTDLFLYDLKLMDDTDHIRYTGVSNKPILENLKYLIFQGKQIIIRIPVIPGITDTLKNIQEIKEFLSNLMKERRSTSPLKISLLPYHSIAKNKYARFHIDNKMKHLKDLTKESLIPIKKEFEAEGFQVKIGS